MTIEIVLHETLQSFKESGIPSPDREAEQLVALVLGKSWSDLHLSKDQEFPAEKRKRLTDCISRRKKGEPLAYIEGLRHFYKYDFHVSPAVLIPRPETEIIVEKAIEEFKGRSVAHIFDIGCGSGCLGLSLAKEYPHSTVDLFDISESALEITKKNVQALNLAAQARLHCGEVSETPQTLLDLKGRVDLIVANPPYIAVDDDRLEASVRNFEPKEALFAGNNGLEWIEKWMKWSEFYLSPQGLAIFEFGKGQSESVQKLIEKTNMNLRAILKDYSQVDRHIVFAKG